MKSLCQAANHKNQCEVTPDRIICTVPVVDSYVYGTNDVRKKN